MFVELRFSHSKGISIVPIIKNFNYWRTCSWDIYIYIYIHFFFNFRCWSMSASTTLVIQTQHVLTLLDPSSVLVRKNLLDMVMTAQVWNANVSLPFPSPATIILTYISVLLLAIFIYHSFSYIYTTYSCYTRTPRIFKFTVSYYFLFV